MNCHCGQDTVVFDVVFTGVLVWLLVSGAVRRPALWGIAGALLSIAVAVLVYEILLAAGAEFFTYQPPLEKKGELAVSPAWMWVYASVPVTGVVFGLAVRLVARRLRAERAPSSDET